MPNPKFKRGVLQSGAALLTLLVVSVFSMAARAQPRMPFVDKGACPFECCSYRQWTVKKETVVRSAMRDGAPVSFRVKRGERVRGLTGAVVITRPGIAEVLKPVDEGDVKLAVGDRIYLLTDQGEGYMTAWFKGRRFGAEAYLPAEYKIVRHPSSVWWVKVRNRNGKIGWSRQPENFGNKDECGID
jgi:hypothetical protein